MNTKGSAFSTKLVQELYPSSNAGPEITAVIDIGSNSGRLVVLERTKRGHFELLEDVHAPLRLVEAVDTLGVFPQEAMDHTISVLQDFRAVAQYAGAGRIIAVGTAAVREARNGEEFIARLQRDLGFEIEIISGKQEAEYAFYGAIHGLGVDNGMLVDIGGGSMQIVRFRKSQLVDSWSFPLGALRLSTHYLTSDPPERAEIEELTGYVKDTLTEAGVPRLRAGESFVGTGGTIRNLAKIDRRGHKYPLSRLHGYTVTRQRLLRIVHTLAGQEMEERAKMGGLNPDRTDSIVGGGLTILTLLNVLHASEIKVSGQGLREGLALERAKLVHVSAREARNASIDALTRRFTRWNRMTAERCTKIAIALAEALPAPISPNALEMLAYATTVLDIGRAIDYYNRHDHAADIITETDLAGFSHEDIALLSASIRRADNGKFDIRAYRPLLTTEDEETVTRLGALLDIADTLEKRCGPGVLADLAVRRVGDALMINVPLLDHRQLKLLSERYAGVLGGLTLCAC